MDGLKEIIEAFNARLKIRVMGSVILAFIAANWKVIFYVIFEKAGAEAKFKYFDENTTRVSLILIPIGAGVLLAFLMPWISYVGAKISSFPDNKMRELKNNSQHLDVLDKFEYETRLEEFKARKSKAIVETAKAGEEAKSIQDQQAREKVQQELEESEPLVASSTRPKLINNKYKMSKYEKMSRKTLRNI